MKNLFILIVYGALISFVASCKKDNYNAPKSELKGAILYQGDTVHVGSLQVNFQLWESGFGKLTPINVNVDQSGMYSAVLFDGTYKLVFPRGQGPFIPNFNGEEHTSDTLEVKVGGSTTMDIEVLPYYMIKDAAFSLTGDDISSTVSLEKIAPDELNEDIENISLYLNKGRIVDNTNNISSASIQSGDIDNLDHIELEAKVPDMEPKQDYIFARIGVKIKNVEDRIFSGVVKVAL